MGTRPERVQEAIRQEVSKIIQNELKDPRIGFLTITAVEVTPDLRYARIFFTALGEMKDKMLALKGLKSAKGYIKGRLADEIKLRFMPEIEFKIDESWERIRHLDDIFNKLEKEKRDAGDSGGDTKV